MNTKNNGNALLIQNINDETCISSSDVINEFGKEYTPTPVAGNICDQKCSSEVISNTIKFLAGPTYKISGSNGGVIEFHFADSPCLKRIYIEKY